MVFLSQLFRGFYYRDSEPCQNGEESLQNTSQTRQYEAGSASPKDEDWRPFRHINFLSLPSSTPCIASRQRENPDKRKMDVGPDKQDQRTEPDEDIHSGRVIPQRSGTPSSDEMSDPLLNRIQRVPVIIIPIFNERGPEHDREYLCHLLVTKRHRPNTVRIDGVEWTASKKEAVEVTVLLAAHCAELYGKSPRILSLMDL